jgi:CBS domain-containing protein
MTNDLITAELTSGIFNVMETMASKNVGRIIITDRQKPVGIFTEHDVLTRVMNRSLDIRAASVDQVMTSPLKTVSSETRIVEALGAMYRGNFRHLLVRDERGNIIGMISMRRILKLAVELGQGLQETRTIGSIMSPGLTTVEETRSIYETLEIMIGEEKRCVVVLSDSAPSGIFTERDVLRRVAIQDTDAKKTTIREVMTERVVTAPYSAFVGEVLAEMYQRGFRHMPIRGEQGGLAGIVSMTDVLQYAKALNIDEMVRKAWMEVKEFWDSEEQYTPG